MSAQGQPTLVHGDIWAGNVMVSQGEDGWHLTGIVDPGTQYADVEMELAYLEVFNTVGADFFQEYIAHRPLRPVYELRRLFYWLNTYMIHVWIFGDAHYHTMTARIAAAIAQQV
jgi:fructosamine-3-kinase